MGVGKHIRISENWKQILWARTKGVSVLCENAHEILVG